MTLSVIVVLSMVVDGQLAAEFVASRSLCVQTYAKHLKVKLAAGLPLVCCLRGDSCVVRVSVCRERGNHELLCCEGSGMYPTPAPTRRSELLLERKDGLKPMCF